MGHHLGTMAYPYEFWKMLANDPAYKLKKEPTLTNEDNTPDIVKTLNKGLP